MDILKLNTSDYLGKMAGEWRIDEIKEERTSYIIYLEKDGDDKKFLIPRAVIKGKSLNLPVDVYEVRYRDYEDSALLNLSEILNGDIVANTMKTLIEKYSKFDK